MTVASRPSLVLAGRYRLDAPLGQRGDGWFCRAHDLVLDRPVTVKMFRSTVDQAAARTFAAQARSLTSLRHDHLVALHDGGVADGHPYLVLESVDGFDSLDVACEEPLSAADTAALGAGLADALARLHAKGIVHGDLTLASVLVDANGQRRLVGFGFGGAGNGTASADVHALGLVLRQCLSGPDEPEPDGTVPWPLARVLTAMTNGEPERRPSAAVCAHRLRRAAAALEPGRWSPTAAAVQRGRAAGLALVGGLVTVGVIAVAPAFMPEDMPSMAAPVQTTSSQPLTLDSTATTTPQQPVPYQPPATSRRPTSSEHPTTSALPTTSTQLTTTATQPPPVSADPTTVAPTTTEKKPPGLAKKPGGLPPGWFKKLVDYWSWPFW
ncbi:protein kinase [Kutzneria chonburiensis]|uniref:non-specific serine/threonine protein kinase n=1 Tax=Kutzneria chonburiensis TaxID=1483604 RepID=A0ABV6MPQ6_9PSEU|nr:protein kinase [Kutzneria chonburiensis]